MFLEDFCVIGDLTLLNARFKAKMFVVISLHFRTIFEYFAKRSARGCLTRCAFTKITQRFMVRPDEENKTSSDERQNSTFETTEIYGTNFFTHKRV